MPRRIMFGFPSLSSKLAKEKLSLPVWSSSDCHIDSADNEEPRRKPILQPAQSDSQAYSAHGLRGRSMQAECRAACSGSELLAAARLDDLRPRRGRPQDHWHRLRSVRSYDCRDAATLACEFWVAVDAALREPRVIR